MKTEDVINKPDNRDNDDGRKQAENKGHIPPHDCTRTESDHQKQAARTDDRREYSHSSHSWNWGTVQLPLLVGLVYDSKAPSQVPDQGSQEERQHKGSETEEKQ
jgi:hypothetical protein